MIPHRAQWPEVTCESGCGTLVTAVGSKPWTLATWSSFAGLSDRSTHGSDITGHRYKESVFVADLNCLASLYVGSRLFIVFVTNPLTIFKVCIWEPVGIQNTLQR